MDADDIQNNTPVDTSAAPAAVSASMGPRWSLGGIVTALLVVQVVTGLVLVFIYRPSLPEAYFDTVDLSEVGRLGYVRALHAWGSHAVVAAALLHLFRLVLIGGYRPPRQLNWMLGTTLLILVLALAATGHVLPWDAVSHGAIAALFEGAPDETTLVRAYALHTVVLPLLTAGLVVLHVWRSWRDRDARS